MRDYGEPGQLGLEATPEEYVAKMVEIFAEVRRVLRDDGTLWLNLGDSYVSARGRWSSRPQTISGQDRGEPGSGKRPDQIGHPYLKDKDLCGIPWRVAFALQADGWYLRSDIIWSKPNPMPESVTDRPTKAHEYMFLLTKKAKYYYDADAIREKSNEAENIYRNQLRQNKDYNLKDPYKNNFPIPRADGNRNRRTVWEIATQPYPEAHFATFPEKLVEPCILAGSNDRACGICGAAWERISEEAKEYGSYHNHEDDLARGQRHEKGRKLVGEEYYSKYNRPKTLGFRPSCEHDNGESRSIILDPFMGSGTVALVALKHGRDYIGIELSRSYIAMAMKRLKPLGNRPLPQQEKIFI